MRSASWDGSAKPYANAPAQHEEHHPTPRLSPQDPIVDHANISTDGVMVLIRQEGWKEVKLTTLSAVAPCPPQKRPATCAPGPARRSRVTLTRHSYQAGLWDADTMAEQQYAEGVRRGLDTCARLRSVNDGAVWIERITSLNFPEAVHIIDWSHASEHVWQVANAVFGTGTAPATQWAETQLDRLWAGEVSLVVAGLHTLEVEQVAQAAGRQEVQQAAGYFQNNAARMHYADYRAQGCPIGSGTVESGARSVVQQRLKRPGRGWGRSTGQAMLAGLSELHSGRFDHAWCTPCAVAV